MRRKGKGSEIELGRLTPFGIWTIAGSNVLSGMDNELEDFYEATSGKVVGGLENSHGAMCLQFKDEIECQTTLEGKQELIEASEEGFRNTAAGLFLLQPEDALYLEGSYLEAGTLGEGTFDTAAAAERSKQWLPKILETVKKHSNKSILIAVGYCHIIDLYRLLSDRGWSFELYNPNTDAHEHFTSPQSSPFESP